MSCTTARVGRDRRNVYWRAAFIENLDTGIDRPLASGSAVDLPEAQSLSD
jgi:hypothetical protein